MGYTRKEKEKILSKGLQVYKDDPTKLNHHHVAKELDISNAKIHYHFGKGLKDAVLKYGVKKGDSHLIVQLYASQSELVTGMCAIELQKHQDAVFKST